MRVNGKEFYKKTGCNSVCLSFKAGRKQSAFCLGMAQQFLLNWMHGSASGTQYKNCNEPFSMFLEINSESGSILV